MAKSRHTLSARVSQAAGRRRKKPTSPVERAFDDVRQVVSDTADRLFGQSGQGKATTKKGSVKKTGAKRIRSGQQRQATAKKAGAARIRSGQKTQAAAKKSVRRRGVNTS